MAYNYYYHQDTNKPPFHFHLLLFLLILVLPIFLSWYSNYESTIEQVVDYLHWIIMLLPLVLLMAVHVLSSYDPRWIPFSVIFSERESIHRVGGSPWGLGVVLVVVLFLISHQSYFHESWFPLLRRQR
ncbi:Oxidoreductase/transition metal ion-binding protein [Rhynchospora pubera]|uniref:Oxidoreductase/transition metal ion-binding protein n=1 Tax=Rhynchospora pubera TaxID=906938 RepID=A0AAV8DF02_9POAL|nr:Oxidoreductase/transition metal ion-binding protein [Rhynchospora pubera]